MYKRKELGSIAVLAGGVSSERDISIKSGRAVYGALKRQGCDVTWVKIKGKGIKKALSAVAFDVAFIALHGRLGEDGTVQKILEAMSRPYTGSGVAASRLALDKIASRAIFKRNGIPVPRCAVLGAKKGRLPDGIEFPVVVKPSNEGSSIGLSLARNHEELADACKTAFSYSKKILVEEFIRGSEITVGILGRKALPVVRIIPKRPFYDFRAKYLDKDTKYEVPARIPPEVAAKAKRLALAAYDSLKCADFSRVDMLVDEKRNLYVLEINTIPGMTERSLLPKAAAAAGIDFDSLCLRLVKMALRNNGGKA